MTSIAYTIRQGPNGLEVQFAADIDFGKEIEKRLAQWLNLAVEAALLEIRSHMRSGVTIEKEGIAKLARAACSRIGRMDCPDSDWKQGTSTASTRLYRLDGRLAYGYSSVRYASAPDRPSAAARPRIGYAPKSFQKVSAEPP